jgi:hypothetical protein
MGGAEFMEKVFAEGRKQVRVAAKRRRKQFGNRWKERQKKKSPEAEAELGHLSGFMDRVVIAAASSTAIVPLLEKGI